MRITCRRSAGLTSLLRILQVSKVGQIAVKEKGEPHANAPHELATAPSGQFNSPAYVSIIGRASEMAQAQATRSILRKQRVSTPGSSASNNVKRDSPWCRIPTRTGRVLDMAYEIHHRTIRHAVDLGVHGRRFAWNRCPSRGGMQRDLRFDRAPDESAESRKKNRNCAHCEQEVCAHSLG